jgi:type III secretion protein SpaR/YscT/HrcT
LDNVNTLLGQLLGADPTAAMVAVGAVMARVGAAVWLAPFLGGRLIPMPVKTGVVLVFTLLLYPQVVKTVPAGLTAPVALALVAKEGFVGMALGFVVAVVFWAAEAAGRMIDTSRGANMAEVMVPQTGARTSPMGDLFFQLALVIFIVLGGHRIFVTSLGASYLVLPVASVPEAEGLLGFALLCGRLTADLFLLGLTLAAPVIAAIFLSDLTLGLINRFTPNINVFFLAMPAKALIGIGILVLATGLLLGALPPILGRAVVMVDHALRLLAG